MIENAGVNKNAGKPVKGECALGKVPARPDPGLGCVCWPLAWSPLSTLGTRTEADRRVVKETGSQLQSCNSPGTADKLPHPQTSVPHPERDQRHGPSVFHSPEVLLQSLKK